MAKPVEKKSQDTKELRDQPVGLRLRKSLKSKLDAFAAKDRRALATYVEIVLEEHVEAREIAEKAKK